MVALPKSILLLGFIWLTTGAALAQPKPDIVTTLQGNCNFSLPGLARGPCHNEVMWMVLASGRSLLLFTYFKSDNQKITFMLSGGADRQPNLENYYLSVDKFQTWWDKDNQTTLSVEGECHFEMMAAKSGNPYRSIQCSIYNRADAVAFSFNLESIVASETKADGTRFPPDLAPRDLRPQTRQDRKATNSAIGSPTKSAPTSTLMARVTNCQAMRRKVKDWTSDEDNGYRRQGCWHRVEADNGAAYLIDLGLIQDFAGGATTAVYGDEGTAFNVMNMKRWYFTCKGQFSVMQNSGSLPPMSYAPPRSIAAQIANIVCSGARISAVGN